MIKSFVKTMCRNIKTLYNFQPAATQDEIRAAALQFVRKISGLQKPSAINQPAFECAIDEITLSSEKLLNSLITSARPKDREEEAEKARARNRRRFGGDNIQKNELS